jgi:hypothetical protein
LDLVGDATYTDYGLRLLRGNSGANAESNIAHKGTGALSLITEEAAPIVLATSNTERLRITSAGNVGIGTTSPGELLEVSATTDPKIQFTDVGNVISKIGISASTALTFEHNGAERLRIDASGNVGIGTSSPTQLLSLAGTSANILLAGTSNSYTTYNIGASNVGYVGDANWIFAGSSSDFGIRATSNLVFGIGATERLRIDSSGNVGIGTSSPAAALDIFGNLFFSAASPQIQFNAGGAIIRAPAANSLAFLSDSTNERLRIDSAGNVGIGTSTPSSPLEVAGQINAVAPFAGFAALQTAAGTGFRWVLNNDGTFFLQRTTDGFVTGSISINVDSSNRVGIGTTSPTTLLDVNTDTVRVRTARTPASASATGATGEICWDANYIYVCTATNTWKRSAISTW